MELEKGNIIYLEIIRNDIIESLKDAEEIISKSWNTDTIRDAKDWITIINAQIDNGGTSPTPTLQDTIDNLWDDLYL